MKPLTATCLAVLALVAGLFGPALLGGRLPLHRDAGTFYLPLFELVRHEWSAGRWALWNPYENGGTPLLANPTASVLYPARIVVFQGLAPFGLSTAACLLVYVLLHLALAAGAAWRLAGAAGAGESGRGLAAISYAFGAVILFQYSNPAFLVGAAWLPLTLVAGDALARRGRMSDAAKLAGCLAMMVLGGDPETAYLAAAAVGLEWVLVEVKGEREAAPLRRLGALGAAALLALALSAAQTLPTVELARMTSRASPDTPQDPYVYSLSAWRLLEPFWPNVSGPTMPVNGRWLELLAGDEHTGGLWEPSIYHGAAIAVLALCAIRLRRGSAWTVSLSWLAVLGLIGAIGRAGGLYPLLHALAPGFRAFRYPAKLLTFWALGTVILAALAWTQVEREAARARRVLRAAAVGSAAAATAALASAPWFVPWIAGSDLARVGGLYGPLRAGIAWRSLVAGPAQAAVVLALTAWLASRPKLRPAILAIVALDLAVANRGLIVSIPASLLAGVPEAATTIAGDTSGDDPLPPRIHRAAAYAPLRFQTDSSADRPAEIYAWSRRTLQPKIGVPQVAYADALGTMELYDLWWFYAPLFANRGAAGTVVHPRRGYDMWGARYFLLPASGNDLDENRSLGSFLPNATRLFVSPPDQNDYQVLRNDRAFPRAWMVHDAIATSPIRGVRAGDRKELFREMLYAGDDPRWVEPELHDRVRDPRTTAWIEHPDPRFVRSLVSPLPDGVNERVRWVRYEPTEIELEAEVAAAGVLVVAESWYPGWSARVDGAHAEILRVNRAMRGIALGPGHHRIEMRYRPASFRVGVAVSALALAAWAAALTAGTRGS